MRSVRRLENLATSSVWLSARVKKTRGTRRINGRDSLVILVLLAAVNSLVGGARLQGFLARTPAIATHADLENYKGVVRRQMYQALVQMALLVAALLASVVGLARGRLSLFWVLAGNAAVLALGLAGKVIETKARSLPVREDGLAAEYRRVSASWLKKALPDF